MLSYPFIVGSLVLQVLSLYLHKENSCHRFCFNPPRQLPSPNSSREGRGMLDAEDANRPNAHTYRFQNML